MNAATTFAYRPIQVSHRQFPRLNKFSSFKLDLSLKFISTPPLTMDSVTNRAEGFNVGGIEQEALIDGSKQPGIISFILNVLLSTALKRILNHERPVSTLRSDPGMPSSHAQSIFYTVTFCIISMVEYFGFNGITAVTSVLIFAMGSYFSWLRVSQRLHTLNQVAVGAVLGFCFSIFWFWLWDAIVMKAFIAHFWVQIVAVVGAAGCCVGFLPYVIRNWVLDDQH